MRLDGSLPWQREPTEASSKKSKLIIFILCRRRLYILLRYSPHKLGPNDNFNSGLLTVIFCTLLASIQKSQVYHAGLIILLLSTAISMLGLVLYLCFLPRAIGRVYFMVILLLYIYMYAYWCQMVNYWLS